MKASELKKARAALGLSAAKFATLTGVKSGRTVRRWEASDRDIPGSVPIILMLVRSSPEAREAWLQDIRGNNLKL